MSDSDSSELCWPVIEWVWLYLFILGTVFGIIVVVGTTEIFIWFFDDNLCLVYHSLVLMVGSLVL